MLGRDVIFQIERVEQALLSLGNCPIMLFAPTLADKAIFQRHGGGRYFFNRIGLHSHSAQQNLPLPHQTPETRPVVRRLEMHMLAEVAG